MANTHTRMRATCGEVLRRHVLVDLQGVEQLARQRRVLHHGDAMTRGDLAHRGGQRARPLGHQLRRVHLAMHVSQRDGEVRGIGDQHVGIAGLAQRLAALEHLAPQFAQARA